MPIAQLWCIDITGSPAVVQRRIFSIDFEPTDSFEDLSEAIKAKLNHQSKEENVALDVWKLNPAIAREDSRFRDMATTTYTELKEHVMTITPDSGTVGEIYLDLPEEESLHLLVSLRDIPEPKGTIELLCSELMDVKFQERQRKHAEWLDSLGSSDFENRSDVIGKRKRGEDPFRDIPIALLHPAFDRFLLDMHSPNLEVPPELYSLAVKFSSACWNVLAAEQIDQATKKKLLVELIENILKCELMKRTKEGAAFDGLLLVEDRYPALILLGEDDIGSHLRGRCEKVYSKCIRLAPLDDARRAISLPCFLLVISGSHISALGAANPSLDPVLEYLTQFQVCTSMPSDPGAIFENLARLFACLRRAITVLIEYYKELPRLQDHIPRRHLPLRNTFADESGQVVRIDYGNLYKLGLNIWLGKINGRTPVFVKFTRHYCAPAHRLCESMGLAPKLHHADGSPDSSFASSITASSPYLAPCSSALNPPHAGEVLGQFYWRMIVMEYIENGVSLYDFEGTSVDARKISQSMKLAVETLHKENYVFGDLRPTNIVVAVLEESQTDERELRVCLVDFDWAGKAGEARYPAGISVGGRIGWPDGVHPRGLITKEHDLVWLRKWLDYMS